MRTITVVSRTFGEYSLSVDEADYLRLKELGGKWCVVIKRGRPYFQKRLPGNKLVELHRWLMGEPKGKYVDHISGDTLDNRRSNLRVCSNAANIRNGKIRTNNTTGVTGVRQPRGKKWEARIRVNYKIIILGFFDKFEDAVNARKQAEKKYFNI